MVLASVNSQHAWGNVEGDDDSVVAMHVVATVEARKCLRVSMVTALETARATWKRRGRRASQGVRVQAEHTTVEDELREDNSVGVAPTL